MKKLFLCLVVLTMILTACNSGPSDEECWNAKRQMTGLDPLGPDTYDEYVESFERPLTALEVNMILNTNHSPDSVGGALRECIENGWDGWR